jgi:CheY-like chemotaxis protein
VVPGSEVPGYVWAPALADAAIAAIAVTAARILGRAIVPFLSFVARVRAHGVALQFVDHGRSRGTAFASARCMKRILVVEDNEDARVVLADTLRAEGYEVLEAPGGREALEILEHVEPCVVLLDLMMPGMSGEEVLDTLRRSGRLEKLRVVVLTGLERGVDVAGAYLVLPKPIGLHQLVSHMEQLCAT